MYSIQVELLGFKVATSIIDTFPRDEIIVLMNLKLNLKDVFPLCSIRRITSAEWIFVNMVV